MVTKFKHGDNEVSSDEDGCYKIQIKSHVPSHV